MENVALNVAAAIVRTDALTLIMVNATNVQQNLLLPDCLIWTCIVHRNVLLLLGHGESKQAEIRFTRLLIPDDTAGVLWMTYRSKKLYFLFEQTGPPRPPQDRKSAL